MFTQPRLRRINKREQKRATACGQKLFIIGYVFFLALILPFICWGALADPSHPHRGPHFVFSASPGEAALATLGGDICGSLGLNEQAPSPFPTTDIKNNNGPVGQSLPDSVLALLVLAAVGGWVFTIRLLRHSQLLPSPSLAPTYTPLVPIPPPRTS